MAPPTPSASIPGPSPSSTAEAPSAGVVPLSVLMPAYNEEDAIALAVDEVQRLVLDRVPGAELIVINDGSRDGTGRVLDELRANDARIRVIHQQNAGHGGALMAGLDAAQGELLFLIDSDRQIPLDDFPAAWSHVARGADGVFGVRRHRDDPALRVWLSRGIRIVLRVLFSVTAQDANVPYKLFRRAVWHDARPSIPRGTLAPSLFLAIYARRRGYAIVDIDVVHTQRRTGKVSIRRLRLLKFCLKGFQQLLGFRRYISSGR